MARQTRRRRAFTGFALVTIMAAIAVGGWGLHRWAPYADEPTPPTVTWPENVQPMVDFVESTTQLQFVAPVSIEFVADDDGYDERVAGPPQQRTQADVDAAAVGDAVGRAFGLWRGDMSVMESRDLVTGGAPYPATWLPDENTVVVHAKDTDATLSPFTRTELTVALTRALDDQLFHTLQRLRAAPTTQDFQVLVSLSIGHAVWVRDRYVDHLSSDDADDLAGDEDAASTDYTQRVSTVPLAYRALHNADQQLGPAFIEALMQTDRSLIAAAFGDDTPAALDQIDLPIRKYLRRDPLETVTAPTGPADGTVQFSEQLGPFAVYLMLSTGMPANEALTASDGWGNDRYTVYTVGGQVCTDLHLVADSRNDADLLEDGLNGWANARPAAAGALVGRQGNDLYATVCDPGITALQPVPSEAAIDQYFGRTRMFQRRTGDSGKADLSECVAVKFYARFDLGHLGTLDPSIDLADEIDTIEQDCLDSL